MTRILTAPKNETNMSMRPYHVLKTYETFCIGIYKWPELNKPHARL